MQRLATALVTDPAGDTDIQATFLIRRQFVSRASEAMGDRCRDFVEVAVENVELIANRLAFVQIDGELQFSRQFKLGGKDLPLNVWR